MHLLVALIIAATMYDLPTQTEDFRKGKGRLESLVRLVPLAGIEPALLAELDFESSASTSSATGAHGRHPYRGVPAKRGGL